MSAGDPFDDGEALDDPFADEPGGELPVERFVEELEQMMIAGHSPNSIRRWAMTGYSVNDADLQRFKDMIQRSWTLESQTIGQVRRRRDHLRLKYLQVFDAAMAKEKFMPAVKALDSIAKLDGLADPDINLTQINLGGAVQGSHPGQITNGVRDRISKLVETMKSRAEQRANTNGRIIQISEAVEKKDAG